MHALNPCKPQSWNSMSMSMSLSMNWGPTDSDTSDFDFNAPMSSTVTTESSSSSSSSSSSFLQPDTTPSQELPQLPPSSDYLSDIFCGVCSRLNCQLKTHRDFLARTCQAGGTTFNGFGSGTNERAKAPSVDDTLIRAAFTQSYAFVTPEIPVWSQPSSFRLDGFHDFPVPGGDQPEVHELIWNFLNGQLRDVLPPQLHKSTTLDAYKYAYLMAAMSDPVACFCILAVEAVSNGSIYEGVDGNSKTASSQVYQKCIEYLRQSPTDLTNPPTLSGNSSGLYVG